MFEGVFIGRYTKEGNKPVCEGDIVNFVFKEPGKHSGFQKGEARGVVKYNPDNASFEVVVKTSGKDFNEYTNSKYSTKLKTCVFTQEDIGKYPVFEIVSIVGSAYDIDERFDHVEIKETIDELLVLRNLADVELTTKAKKALFNCIDILNKVKKKFVSTEEFVSLKIFKYYLNEGVMSWSEGYVIAKDREEVKKIVSERLQIQYLSDKDITEVDTTDPVIMSHSY